MPPDSLAGIEAMGIIEQTDIDRQDTRLDACRRARLRVALREGRLHMPAGSRKVATALGITTKELALDVERALRREETALKAKEHSPM
jgi:ribosomal protein L19E